MRTLLIAAAIFYAWPAWAVSDNNISVWAKALDGSGEHVRVSYTERTPPKGREHMSQKGIVSVSHPTPAPKNAISVPGWGKMTMHGPNGRSSAMSHDGKVRWDVSLSYNKRSKRGSVQVKATGGCGRGKSYSSNFRIVSSCEYRHGPGARRR